MSSAAPVGSPATVVGPVRAASLSAPTAGPGALLEAWRAAPDALAYFLLNVGDGDTQVVVLPPDSHDGVRRLVVVDVATRRKVPALLAALHRAGLIERPGTAGQLRLLVATHPHFDHIGGMHELLRLPTAEPAWIEQFWDPGFYSPSPAFHDLMRSLEEAPGIRRLQPTSGTSTFLDSVRLTVLAPSVSLRMRFDTYGVQVNDASLTLMIEFPATRVYTESAGERAGAQNRRLTTRRNRRLLLGADAQFASWAQASSDFPDLHDHGNPILQKELAGLETQLAAATTIYPSLSTRDSPGPTLRGLVAEGKLGPKTGQGFWTWTPESTAAAKAKYETMLLAALALLKAEK